MRMVRFSKAIRGHPFPILSNGAYKGFLFTTSMSYSWVSSCGNVASSASYLSRRSVSFFSGGGGVPSCRLPRDRLSRVSLDAVEVEREQNTLYIHRRRFGSRTSPLASPPAPSSSSSSFSFTSSSSPRSPTSMRSRGLPEDPYRNRFTAFFFKELQKGFSSPWVLLGFGVITGFAAFKVVEWWSHPERQRQRQLAPRARIPMKPEHEAIWGFYTARGDETNGSSSPLGDGLPIASPGAAIFDPAVAVAESEALLQRPRLIYAEVQPTIPNGGVGSTSSARGTSSSSSSSSSSSQEEEVVIMEVPEYDEKLKDDIYVRSLHYIPIPSTTSFEKKAEKRLPSSSPSSSSTTTDASRRSTAAAQESENPLDEYFRYMPGGGREHIHGMVKCKRGDEDTDGTFGSSQHTQGTSSGSFSPTRIPTGLVPPCIPYAGDLSRESARKLLLTLGPVHILQDPSQAILPARFSPVKHPEMRALILGLREGSLPRWLSTAYPHFVVDVVEPEHSLIRLAKQFFGFQPHSRLRVERSTAEKFLTLKAATVETAHTAAEHGVALRSLFIPWKRGPVTRKGAAERFQSATGEKDPSPVEDPRLYDLILLDPIDRHGNLPRYIGRLDFLQSLRQVLSPTGVVGVLLPNRDARKLYEMIQHWRMGFHGRSMILIHCRQEPVTMLMTFQDEGGRGQAAMGTIGSADELKDIIRSHLTHYGLERVPQFDLTQEVDSGGGGARKKKDIEKEDARVPGTSTMVKKNVTTTASTPGLPEEDTNASRTTTKQVTSSSGGSSSAFFKILAPERTYEPIDYLPSGHPYLMEEQRRRLLGAKRGGPSETGGSMFSTSSTRRMTTHGSSYASGWSEESEKKKRPWWKIW